MRCAGASMSTTRSQVCAHHRWYRHRSLPRWPDALGRPRIELDQLVAELKWPARRLGRVRRGRRRTVLTARPRRRHARAGPTGAPGLVLLVVDTILGVVSQVRLAVRVLTDIELVVVLNRYEPANDVHRGRRDWLMTVDSLTVVTDLEIVAARDIFSLLSGA